MSLLRILLLIACGMASTSVVAAGDPIRRIDINVTPYYEAAKSPDDTPKVAVHPMYDTLLSSNRREDIAHVRDEIAATTHSLRR